MQRKFIVELVAPLDEWHRTKVALEVAETLGGSAEQFLRLLERGVGPLTRPLAEPLAKQTAKALSAAGAKVTLSEHHWEDALLTEEAEFRYYNRDSFRGTKAEAAKSRSRSLTSAVLVAGLFAVVVALYLVWPAGRTWLAETYNTQLAATQTPTSVETVDIEAINTPNVTTANTPAATELEQLLRRSEGNDTSAQLELAERYLAGNGVAPDKLTGLVFLREAARGGHPQAQYQLGVWYAEEEDPLHAERWLHLAESAGVPEAAAYLADYPAGLEQSQVEAASSGAPSGEPISVTNSRRPELAVPALSPPQLPNTPPVEDTDLTLPDPVVLHPVPRPEVTVSVRGEGAVSERQPETLADPRGARVTTALPSGFADTVAAALTLASTGTPANPQAVFQTAPQAEAFKQTLSQDPNTDLFRQAREGTSAAISRALRRGADANVRDGYGQTPLMYAAAANTRSATTELISGGAQVNAQSDAGWSALMYAARDNPAVLETLLLRGADASLLNSSGQTALDIALEVNPAAVAVLREASSR